MKILSIEEYQIQLLKPENETHLPQIKLFIKSEVSILLCGAFVEAIIEYQENYFVFTTNEIPSEESLNIYYISQNAKILDAAVIGSPYSTGSFKSLQILESGQIRFEFIGATLWEIHIFKKAIYYFPFLQDPKGVSRSFKLKYHFKVSGSPLP